MCRIRNPSGFRFFLSIHSDSQGHSRCRHGIHNCLSGFIPCIGRIRNFYGRERLRSVKLAKGDLSLQDIVETKGNVRIISVVPSLDTKVCEQQTHYLSEKNKGLDAKVNLYTVSVDTPFAQDRFAKEAKINNVTFLSDFRSGEFGLTHGLLLDGPHLLARAVMVVDKNNVIRYLQITPNLANMPDMEAAFAAAKALL